QRRDVARSELVDLKQYIRDIPDFPQPGVLFRDITPLLRAPTAFRQVLDQFTDRYRGEPGKLPAPRMSIEYTLEYGSSQLDIASDALGAGQRVVIVDDVLATGGTANAAAKLVELLGGQVFALQFLIELRFLEGRGKLDGYRV